MSRIKFQEYVNRGPEDPPCYCHINVFKSYHSETSQNYLNKNFQGLLDFFLKHGSCSISTTKMSIPCKEQTLECSLENS